MSVARRFEIAVLGWSIAWVFFGLFMKEYALVVLMSLFSVILALRAWAPDNDDEDLA